MFGPKLYSGLQGPIDEARSDLEFAYSYVTGFAVCVAHFSLFARCDPGHTFRKSIRINGLSLPIGKGAAGTGFALCLCKLVVNRFGQEETMSKARVLVVDDDVMLRDFLENRLTGEGFEVTTAPSPGKDSGTEYDLVLQNIEKPFSLGKLNRKIRSLIPQRSHRRGL